MSDMLRTGATWLGDMQRKHAATRVHYLRGTSAISIPATFGQSQFDVTDSNGLLSRVDTHDFIVHAVMLRVDGIRIEPQVGDRVIVGDLEDGQAYEVAAIVGQDVWRWADEYRLRFRIHTKYVGAHP